MSMFYKSAPQGGIALLRTLSGVVPAHAIVRVETDEKAKRAFVWTVDGVRHVMDLAELRRAAALARPLMSAGPDDWIFTAVEVGDQGAYQIQETKVDVFFLDVDAKGHRVLEAVATMEPDGFSCLWRGGDFVYDAKIASFGRFEPEPMTWREWQSQIGGECIFHAEFKRMYGARLPR